MNPKNLIISFFISSTIFFTCQNLAIENGNTTIKDADNNIYNVVKIGTQIWTSENLRTTRYNDGSPIPNIIENVAWDHAASGAYCSYNNTLNSDSIVKFGLLYNWYTVNSGKLAPGGWRVPTDEDFNILENYLIENGYNFDGTNTGNKIAKSLSSTTDWDAVDDSGAIGMVPSENNGSGFSAFPGGHRYTGGAVDGNNYGALGKYSTWWTSSTAFSDGNYSTIWIRELVWCNYYLRKASTNCKVCGFSVRLIKN